jgi:hypothetical protein
MKKTLLMTALLLAASTSAFAVTSLTNGGVAGSGATIYGSATATNPVVKLSTGVFGSVAYNTSAYSIYTKHSKGSKIFGTANDSTSIYWKAVAAGDLATQGTTSGNIAFDSSWTTY